MERDQKVAIVTGAGGGIGRAISVKLVRAGMRLVLVDKVPEGVESLAQEIVQEGGQAIPCRVDVGDEADVRRCLEQTIVEYGRVDCLVNNAGISPKKPDGAKATLVEIPLAEWETVMRVNLTSVFLMCAASIPHMQRQGAGAIVSISSSAALDGGILAAAHYSASKGAVAALTRTLAKEVARHGIRVNAVAPGRVDTPMAKLSSDERNQAARARIPLGRFAEPEEIADSVAYLLSDQASYVTGVTLNVSGGYVVA
ncbi:SDR family NAD(P)-dependent oxidoreductase [Castellaniella sp. GW247-6E4]|uniref:SDR family NAD(P)-dependent oxidoreductase n=1 Tax=Castellaniella sp. GW247-6E4 TaxID=3140380 RepID=UPI003315B4BD